MVMIVAVATWCSSGESARAQVDAGVQGLDGAPGDSTTPIAADAGPAPSVVGDRSATFSSDASAAGALPAASATSWELAAPAAPLPPLEPPATREQPVEVVVRGRSKLDRLRQSAQAVKVVDTEQAKRESADLGEVLARTPGVGVQRMGGLGSDMRFSLNGLTQQHIRFFLDGVPLDFTLYALGIANVPVNLVERVEIYSGVVPMRFGADALGGAINLATDRSAAQSRAAASYQVGSFGTQRLTASGQYGKPDTPLFVRTAAFFDDARNDYPVDVKVTNATGGDEDATIYRFHDAYRAFGAELEVGVHSRPWARRLSVNVFASDSAKELQNNARMTVPYGQATSDEQRVGANLRYENSWRQKVTLEAIAGYGYGRRSFRDLTTCVWDWYGRCVAQRDRPGEVVSDSLLGGGSDSVYWSHAGYGRFLLSMRVHEQHTLRVSLAPTLFARTGSERQRSEASSRDPLAAERRVDALVNGLEYELDLFEGRLENILFAKQYMQFQRSEETIAGGVLVRRNRDTQRAGWGDALRYRFNEWVYAKASYEFATRLPGPDEIFGNGAIIRSNLQLEPELSHNANLGVAVSAPQTVVGALRGEATGFLRDVDDLILRFGDNTQVHRNVYSARSTGVELNASWTSLREFVNLSANVTYQQFVNTSTGGLYANYEGDRIPNGPWLFANAAARLLARGVFSANDEISLGAYSRWLGKYYLSWESLGQGGAKQSVDDQLTHALNLSYVTRGDRSSLSSSIEIDNLTDAKVYDFYGVQRPGRAFYAKLIVAH